MKELSLQEILEKRAEYNSKKEQFIYHSLSLLEVTEHLNIFKHDEIDRYSPYAVLQLLKTGELRAIWDPNLAWRFPEYQFQTFGLYHTLGILILQKRLPLGREVELASWMISLHAELGKTPSKYLFDSWTSQELNLIVRLAKEEVFDLIQKTEIGVG